MFYSLILVLSYLNYALSLITFWFNIFSSSICLSLSNIIDCNYLILSSSFLYTLIIGSDIVLNSYSDLNIYLFLFYSSLLSYYLFIFYLFYYTVYY